MNWIQNLKQSISPELIKMEKENRCDINNKIYHIGAKYVFSKGRYVCVTPICDKDKFCFITESEFKESMFDCWYDYYIASDLIVDQFTGNILKNEFGETGDILNI